MQQAEEDALVMAAQNGNQRAFEMIFRRYQKPILRYAFKVCRDRQMAEDAVQDSWITLAKSLKRLRDPRAFRSWLYKTVHWRLMDLMRVDSSRTQNEDEFDDQLHSVSTDKISGVSDIGEALNRLPLVEKQIIHLFYLDELKLAEVAVVLDIPIGTVKSRLNRARNMMRERFG